MGTRFVKTHIPQFGESFFRVLETLELVHKTLVLLVLIKTKAHVAPGIDWHAEASWLASYTVP